MNFLSDSMVCLNKIEMAIIITSASLLVVAVFGVYYAYKVMRNYQIRPFVLRCLVRNAEYYLAENEDPPLSNPPEEVENEPIDFHLVENILARKQLKC